jgi:hypothetical protein
MRSLCIDGDLDVSFNNIKPLNAAKEKKQIVVELRNILCCCQKYKRNQVLP